MVSLWGSKNGDEETHSGSVTPREAEEGDAGANTAGSTYSRQRRQPREADERTRLIPPTHAGFLDPDDPAVTPYNLWTVRFLRSLSLLFLLISFIWWIVLLVSLFVSPPGLNFRGSGFTAFSYATLTVGNLLVAVLFYTSPSQAQRVSCLVIAVLLLVNLVLILLVRQLRLEEGWPGVATVAWATLMAIWTVIVDRVVEWGKKQEEERLTGRAETRRTLREWCSVFSSAIILIVFIVLVVFITAVLILRARDSTLNPPGERYWVHNDKYQVHLYCEGSAPKGAPTVFFEGGENPVEDGLASIAANALKNGTIDRYCYWDRPGFGFSDNGPSPLSAGMVADALAEALARADEEGPWVLVSAGVGSIYSRIFASRHANEVKGIMLIDGLHEDLLYRIGSPARGLGLWARGVISPLGIERLPPAIFKGRRREERVLGKGAYQNDKVIKAKLQENLAANSLTKQEIGAARTIQSRDTKLSVISSGISVHRDSEWERRQRDLCDLTDEVVGCDVVSGAPHEVWRVAKGRRLIEKRLGELVKE